MCVLCDDQVLELLTTPLDDLAPGELADAIRAARDAAEVSVADHAEAVVRGGVPLEPAAGLYDDAVVRRALDADVVTPGEADAWRTRLGMAAGQTDPRVQAFVSSCSEVVDEYRVVAAERRQVVERFLEAGPVEVRFAGFGPDGEPWFEYRGESCTAVTQEEALEIVERELRATLHTLEPDALFAYTALPDDARDAVVRAHDEPPEIANAVLAELVDLTALAEDRIRSHGYSPYFRGDPPREAIDVRFGDWIIVRLGRAL